MNTIKMEGTVNPSDDSALISTKNGSSGRLGFLRTPRVQVVVTPSRGLTKKSGLSEIGVDIVKHHLSVNL